MDQDFNLLQTQRLQYQSEFKQHCYQCNLCNGITDELFAIQCVEIVIQVCLNCHNIINNNDNDKQLLGVCWHLPITDIPYCSKVLFKLDSQAKFYNLKIKECMICCIQKICCKVCMNEHYFCIDCIDTYIQHYYSQTYRIPCPEQLCNQELNHYLIAQFISLAQVKYWKIINSDLFCIKKSCCSQLQINPYFKLQPLNLIKMNENVMQCLSCKTKICNTCHTQVKGSLHKHKLYCNQLAINQFQIYCQNNLVLKCPKCRVLCQPRSCLNQQNHIQETKIQQCQICNTEFCILCKSAHIVLFPQMNQYYFDKQYLSYCQTCKSIVYSKKNKCKIFTKRLFKKCFYIPKFFRILCKILIIIIWLPGFQFMQVSKMVGDYVDNKINKIDKGKAPYFFCCCGPIIAFSIICSIFILYAILFIPLFIRNCYRKINDQQL
ncbi:unnamed protein product [Paramecium primaurelia]|uniref:RING-type domain-containing protein n=1 Tax=Paramecium primaurelia TaxID=5886 RepID=A0A8S1PW68_PARPR|nr:unnamed protein product [Paramecium primaurelia]